MATLKKIVISLVILTLAVPAVGLGYIYFKLNSISVNDSETKGILGQANYKEVKGITNILLVGVDARSLKDVSRSDAMMILTIDDVNKSLKLTSLARDSLVNIPGHGEEKLTHAYAYGGINLLLETIEQNFELDINNYSIVNYSSFMDIIDVIDGVEVDVKQGELTELNRYINDCFKLYRQQHQNAIGPKHISSTGTQTLNGYQALAYSRIRYNDSAYGRDNRQRQVLQAIVNKASSLSVTKYPDLMNAVLPYIQTNMKPTQMLAMGLTTYKIGNFDIKQLEFPIIELSNGGIQGSKGWVLDWTNNKYECLEILNNFIFEDKTYEGSNM